MKIKIDIDCTPQEARSFFGLPDVAPLQESVMKEIQDKMMASLQASDAETLFKAWMPVGMQGVEQMQKAFWANVRAAQGKPTEGD